MAMEVKEISDLSDITPDETTKILVMNGFSVGQTTWGNIRAVIDGSYPSGTCTDDNTVTNKNVTLSNYNGTVIPREFSVSFTNMNSNTNIKLVVKNSNGNTLGTYTVLDGIGENRVIWKSGAVIMFNIVGTTARMINSSSNDFIKLTEAEYNALSDEDKNKDTIYFITDDEADKDIFYTKEQVNEKFSELQNVYYKKPNTGIPKSDLSNSVQDSLDKADTALQTHQELKTINNQSIVGSGNIEIQGGTTFTYETSNWTCSDDYEINFN